MSKNLLNIDNWKTVLISDIFDYIGNGTVNNLYSTEEGNMPVVSSSIFNNGVVGYYDVPGIYENMITISKVNGQCFYHPYKFNSTSSVHILKPKEELSKEEMLFIATIITQSFKKFNFTNKCNKNNIIKESIKLPKRTKGNSS